MASYHRQQAITSTINGIDWTSNDFNAYMISIIFQI